MTGLVVAEPVPEQEAPVKTSILTATLLAALAASFAGPAIAGSMTATPIVIDTATAPSVIDLPEVTVTFGNNLTYQDDILITLAGAEVKFGSPSPAAESCLASGSPAFPVGYVTVGLNYWNFRVTSVGGILIDDKCTFRNLKITKASLGSSCEVKASYSAKRFMTGNVVDSAGPITVATVTPCGPPPPPPPPPPPGNTALMYPVDVRGGIDDGPMDGIFDRLDTWPIIVNNGWTSRATALEFDLSAIPADATVLVAMVGFEISVWEGTRSLAIAAYPGDGSVALADFVAGTIVGRPSVTAPGVRPVVLDVTDVVKDWRFGKVGFGGFSLREDPPNCCNYTVMGVQRSALTPVLAVLYKPVKAIGIDIRPGTTPNNVNLRSAGRLPVAILSGGTFNAPTDVAIDSLSFGHDGTELSLVKCNAASEDVNLDGLMDLVCLFDSTAAGFRAGDLQGVLRAETTAGEKIKGVDAVRIVP